MSTQARTRLARVAVIEAARTLFIERGYGATTIDAISALADVPSATLYRLFSSKLGILKALLDVSIAGDPEPVPVADRPSVQSLFADPEQKRMIARFVGVVARINSRTAPVYRILVSAADTDPEAATLLAELTGQRQQGQGRLAHALAQNAALRAKLKEREAADIIHGLASPELYGLFVSDRGWPLKRYEKWLTDLLIDQLLAAERV